MYEEEYPHVKNALIKEMLRKVVILHKSCRRRKRFCRRLYSLICGFGRNGKNEQETVKSLTKCLIFSFLH